MRTLEEVAAKHEQLTSEAFALREEGRGQIEVVEAMNKIVCAWNRNVQVLSSVFTPNDPRYLTPKVISERWHLSAMLTTITSALTQFLPGQPKMLARTRAAFGIEHMPCYLFHTRVACVPPTADGNIYFGFAHDMAEAQTQGDTKKMDYYMEALWTRVARIGGALYSSREVLYKFWIIGHLNYVQAVRVPVSALPCLGVDFEHVSSKSDFVKLFLIADPEIRDYRVMTMTQMANYVSDLTNLFDILDATQYQKRAPWMPPRLKS